VVDIAGTPLDRSLVSWSSPDDVDHRAKLDAWCDTVGPVVIQTTRRTGTVSDRLVVIGWNVHLGAGNVLRVVNDLRAGRFARIATDAAVVLLLQETFRAGAILPALSDGAPVPHRIAPRESAPRGSAVDIATSLGLNLYYLPTMRNGRSNAPDAREDRGLAIMSSLPLSDLQAMELPFERQRRPAAAATIRLVTNSGDSLSVRLINLHLESRGAGRRLWLGSPSVRARQVDALMTSLRPAAATLLEGDLNTWANREPVLERLRREFTPCTDGQPTFRGGLHLDTFFAQLPARWTLTCRRLDQKYGSDHYPIVAVVQEGPS
jgi:endonuclease/exonuclease/phosphatase family metal-dependent hydrolase